MAAVIHHQLSPNRQQATAERVVALLAATAGDPDDPASWAGYARLAPHVLATAPQNDSSPAGRRLALDTNCPLQAKGISSASRTVAEQLLDRWQRELGLDHPDTLTAANTFTCALVPLGEAEPARTLGQDTLQRCRRVLGPDHPTILYLTQAASLGDLMLGGGAAPDRPDRPL
ncbi:tetratricopeptide repeat protein [Geodermatophilus sp. URMC 61]|uniref:tetratricopeptide repeat protein n=1 Tax=Geodermatophilus sp. URMC 61 TaxID=3423411 RepID=UPI00406CBCDF